MFGGTPGTRAVRAARALAFAGFRAPSTVCHGKLPSRGEYVFSEQAMGESVTSWLVNSRPGEESRAVDRRRQVLNAVGITLGRMHASGFIHRRLCIDNLLAHYHDGRFDITLLNNEEVIRRRLPSGRAILNDLAQLNGQLPCDVGLRDRMRFFSAWRRQMRHLDSTATRIIAREAHRLAIRSQRNVA